ncbi:MAG TPA: hypothetical protein VGM88_13125 [Kofleriaceae bacterium]|jgi:hypothetical protein
MAGVEFGVEERIEIITDLGHNSETTRAGNIPERSALGLQVF